MLLVMQAGWLLSMTGIYALYVMESDYADTEMVAKVRPFFSTVFIACVFIFLFTMGYTIGAWVG